MNLKEMSDEDLVDEIIDDRISMDFPQYKTELLSRLARGRKAIEALENEYPEYGFCKSIKCRYFRGDSCIACICVKTAKHFHQWLNENGYKIIKEAADGLL